MRTLLRNGRTWEQGEWIPLDLLIGDGVVIRRDAHLSDDRADRVFDLKGMAVFPGFADVHVHFREPGFSYKETIATGSRAAARGGYTTVCAMPNLNPAPDTPAHLEEEETLIREQSVIRVLPYASITQGQKGEGKLTDMAVLAGRVCGFSDDGVGVREEELMREAMRQCALADSILSAHCEDKSLIPPGAPIHAGRWAEAHGMPGIPSASEYEPIRRDIALCRETGCRYHVCHVSCRESVALIRQAKAEGVNITCETVPHYLLLCEDDLQDDGRFKMNPPLRSREDRDALLEALLDGTIDMIATDHAPHSAEEKSRGLQGSAMGIVGIETAFPLLYTRLVRTGQMTLELLLEKLCFAPRRRFRLDGGIRPGERAELTVFDLEAKSDINPSEFVSKGRATPFAGMEVYGRCKLTLCGDTVAWMEL